jgi:hypothetical protein
MLDIKSIHMHELFEKPFVEDKHIMSHLLLDMPCMKKFCPQRDTVSSPHGLRNSECVPSRLY